MPLARRLVAASAGLSAAVLSLAVLAAPSSTAASQSGSVRTLPGIVGPVSSKASSGSSRGLVVASVSPARSGRAVTFYRRSSSATAWTKVATVRTAKTGDASVASSSATSYAWRATAAKVKGLKAFSMTTSARSWKTSFADEFSARKLGERWRQRYPDAWRPGRTCSHTSSSQVTFTGKTAVLTSRRAAHRPSGLSGRAPSSKDFKKKCKDASGAAHHYVGASIDTSPPTSSQFAFTHGVAAARVKFSALPGQHAAFWLQTKETKRPDTEIDVVESNGVLKTGSLVSGLHYRSNGKPKAVQAFTSKDPKRWSKDYHVFSVEWTARSYIFRVDSTVVLKTTAGRSSKPHDIVLSNVVADWAIHRNHGKPAAMNVDWVRVWQR